MKDALSRAGAVAYVIALGVLLGWLAGCASQTGLYSDSVKRTCTGWYCYIVAPKELVNTRCLDRKSAWKICRDNPNRAECRDVVAQWDDGTPRDPKDPSRTARCCTVLRPKSADDRFRYWIWISEGEDICVAHEHGHIEVFEKDGFRFVPEHHRRLHGFGLDREKKRL